MMGGPPPMMGPPPPPPRPPLIPGLPSATIGMPPMMGNPGMLGLPGMMGNPNLGGEIPGAALADPNQNPALGPLSNGGPEPDEATLEQLVNMLKVMGVGGAASGMPAQPGGLTGQSQVPPGGSLDTGTPMAPHPMGGGLAGGLPSPMAAPTMNPLLHALGGPPR